MDLFEMLKTDHDEVEKILEKMKETTTRAAKSRQSGLEKLHHLLIPHMEAEEEIFYPQLINAGETDVAYEALEEHKTARLVLQDLENMAADDVRWKPYMKVLAELVLHHVEEEESEVFEKTREKFNSEELEQLAERVQERKRKSLN